MKKKIFNSIMAIAIVAIVVIGVIMAGSLLGWFSKKGAVTVKSCIGNAQLERHGVAFIVNDSINMENGDALTVENGSRITLENEKKCVCIDANSQAQIENESVRLLTGELFCEEGACIYTQNATISSESGCISVSAHSGSTVISVFSDEAEIKTEKGVSTVKKGETFTLVDSDDGFTTNKTDISVDAQSNFVLSLLLKADADTCINYAALTKAVEARDTKTASIKEETAGEEDRSCTVSISCEKLVGMKLPDGKDRFVPGNGMIMPPTVVSFSEGETAFDVLKRICKGKKIQIEYSWTPVFDSYYIEGINNIYEFDGGDESGWIYKVNGWSPNYGCSSYKLSDGDVVEWAYTVSGLGKDIGGGVQ